MTDNINDPRHPWARLTAAARELPAAADMSAPYGFATRVAAIAFAHENRVISLLERFSLRALGVASLLALFGVALNYPALSTSVVAPAPVQAVHVAPVEEVELLAADDAVAVVLDFAD